VGELPIDEVMAILMMPTPIRAADGTTFSVEWHAKERTLDELLGAPLAHYIRGPIDRPTREQHYWLATTTGILDEPGTPAELTERADEAFWRWGDTWGE
jgi:hypothetical protein